MEESIDHFLEINPSNEIRFKGPFTQVVTSHLKLKNMGKKTLCYKVKTTAPKMYCVRPNSGLIETGKEIDVLVMLQPFVYSATEKFRHKFLIQSVIADESNLDNSEQLWKTIDRELIREIKLKCSFDPDQSIGGDGATEEDIITPSKNVSNNAAPQSSAASIDELRQQLVDLKAENEKLRSNETRLRKIALQETLDHGVPSPALADHKQVGLIGGNSLTLLIIICLVAFFIGIAVAKFSS